MRALYSQGGASSEETNFRRTCDKEADLDLLRFLAPLLIAHGP